MTTLGSDVDYELDGDEIVIEREGVDEEGEPLEPIRIEIKYDHSMVDNTLEVKHTARGYLVSYLAYDEDCESPESPNDDGAGNIYTRLWDDSHESHDKFREALGLDSYWRSQITGDSIVQEIANDVFDGRTDKDWRDILRDPDKDGISTRDDIKITYRRKWDYYVAQHKANGDFGDEDAVILSVYQHGNRVYQVGSGAGFLDRQWDVSEYSAVWVPNDHLRNVEAKGLTGSERHGKMVEWAGQLVRSMNDWMNGACYGVIVHEYDLEGTEIEEHEECWGFLGTEYAEEELARNIRWALMTEEEREAKYQKNQAESKAWAEAYQKEHA